jgi:hypothetical protein
MVSPVKTILILLPDGVGLRNFVYSNFVEHAKKARIKVIFWNNTSLNLSEFGYNNLDVPTVRVHPISDLLKRAKISMFLDYFERKNRDGVYRNYKFKLPNLTFKELIKLSFLGVIRLVFKIFGLRNIQRAIEYFESRGNYFNLCREQLVLERPDLILTTNQRTLTSVAPILAGKLLGIPTVSFIFSWDNLPKATLVVNTDKYFVWSDFMKRELQGYYNIKGSDIVVTGTPQFEFYYDNQNIIEKQRFYRDHGLNVNVKYICFSGDDATTSPLDPIYLRDLADAVSSYNHNASEGQLGIIFRRCPVDYSNRYDAVVNDFKGLIHPIEPDWRVTGESWSEILAMPQDVKLLVSTVFYSECVINVGSSMVFDFVCYDKPCFYLNYNQNSVSYDWDIERIYDFVHFRSMTSKNAVGWINSKKDYLKVFDFILSQESADGAVSTKNWFKRICEHPVDCSSQRMVEAISSLI